MIERLIKELEDNLREIQIWKQSITSDLAMISRRTVESLKKLEMIQAERRKEVDE